MIQPRSYWPRTAAILIALSLSLSAHALDEEALREALKDPSREVSDRIRDEASKPVEVLTFFGVQQGMTVLDVYAAEGYFTYILSKAVGEDGIVYAQTPRSSGGSQDGRADMTQAQALDTKIATSKLSNVVRLQQSIHQLEIPPESLDFILLSQIFHDYYNGSPARAQQLLHSLEGLLKPGGIIGVIDHAGDEGANNVRMHRIQEADALAAFREAGFIIEAQSELLRNPRDRHRRSIFDPSLNRNTDQFIFRAKKPPQE
ncbi:MAG: methyltransferase domain-containing protein [Pseudohongiellaceae bacterium]|nr:methyltransferase domain-containing protein [Pseudohongiellaceae bacterium]